MASVILWREVPATAAVVEKKRAFFSHRSQTVTEPRTPRWTLSGALSLLAVGVVRRRSARQGRGLACRGYDREAWVKGYDSAQEEKCECISSEALPKGLRGSYFRNGPAKFKVGQDQIMHPFDGDGMVCAVTFDGEGHAYFRNRFVRTPGFVEELKAKKMLYRGQFSPKSGGFLANAFDMRVKNLANTNVMHWADRLFALWEGGKPMELDPLSLSTVGFSDFAGALREKDTFTAHPRFDATTGREVGFQYQPDPVNGITQISFWEFAPGFELIQRVDIEVPGFGFYHDFLVTDSYYILSRAPVAISPQRGLEGLLGIRSMGEAIDFDDQQPTQLVLVPRDGSQVRYIDLDTHFCFHYANGFEENNQLILDFVRTPSLELGNASSQQRPLWEFMELEKLEPNRFTRYEIDISSGTWTKRELSDQHLDFPSINPAYSTKPYRYAWCATSALDGVTAPLQGLVKVDVTGQEPQQMWLPEAEEFLGEVVFCQREAGEAEDDGYLVGISLDGRKKTSSLLIFDAKEIREGPICRLPVPSFIPHALHGSYVPGLVPDMAEIEAAWQKTPTSLWDLTDFFVVAHRGTSAWAWDRKVLWCQWAWGSGNSF